MSNFKHKSVFRRGAEDGAWFGIYLSVLFIFSVSALSAPLLGHIATIMALAVPLVTYFTLRRGFIDNGCFYTFSEVWTQGIVFFACGSLIMALAIVVYSKWINPQFIIEQCNMAIDAYRSIGGPTANEIASSLELIAKQGLLPTPLSLAGNLISFSIFSGSILSMILSLFIRRIRPRNENKQL